MSGGLIDYFSDLAIAECLATMRSRMCAKRHGVVAMDRYFKGVCRKITREDGGGRDDPATYMPPRRLWSRLRFGARRMNDHSVYNKLAIMRHVRWVILNGKLGEYDWGRRFAEFAALIRARVERGDFDFEVPVSFAVEKPGKGTRFVTSFLNLEDKVILRQVAKYLRKTFDSKLSSNCYSFREDGAVDHSLAVKALIDYRADHKGETLWVAECDIRKFFDVIDHRVAWSAFERLARGAGVNWLAKKAVRGYLKAYTSTETLMKGCKPKCRAKCEEYVEKIREALGKKDGEVGVPQGGAISMPIANWVLDIADRRVERWGDENLFYARSPLEPVPSRRPPPKRGHWTRDFGQGPTSRTSGTFLEEMSREWYNICMVKHITLWKLKDEVSDKVAVKHGIKEGLEGLKGQIPGLVDIAVRIEGLASSNADAMLDTTFESEVALKGYATHPAHVAVADAKVRPFTQTRLCLDYEA